MRIWSLLAALLLVSDHVFASESGSCAEPSRSAEGGALLQTWHTSNGLPARSLSPASAPASAPPTIGEDLNAHAHLAPALAPSSEAIFGGIRPANQTIKPGFASDPQLSQYTEVSHKDGKTKSRRGEVQEEDEEKEEEESDEHESTKEEDKERKTKSRRGRSHRDTTTLFYHFHMPRTGGTTAANLINAHICDPFLPEAVVMKWEQSCSRTCDYGLTDNEFVCYPGMLVSLRGEHARLVESINRAQAVAVGAGASRVVFVTTLRRGSERLVSEWLYNMNFGGWWPMTTIDKVSNESLLEYLNHISDPSADGMGYWPGANLQTAFLAYSTGDLRGLEVHDEHFDLAKTALMNGQWLIGFSNCMDQLNEKLYETSTQIHGVAGVPRFVPHVATSLTPGALYDASQGDQSSAGATKSKSVIISPELQKMVDEASRYDNALFDWAWQQAELGVDPRFTRTC